VRRRREIFDAAATALSYPGTGLREAVRRLGDTLAAEPSLAPAAELVRSFETEMTALDDTGLEELYTRTFDLTPDISLETGWQLYGEAYERGSFLVRMREMLRSLGIAETGELPDHLTYMLKALGRLPEDEAGELVRTYLSKSLSKIISHFPERENPYLRLLTAVSRLFEHATHPVEDVTP